MVVSIIIYTIIFILYLYYYILLYILWCTAPSFRETQQSKACRAEIPRLYCVEKMEIDDVKSRLNAIQFCQTSEHAVTICIWPSAAKEDIYGPQPKKIQMESKHDACAHRIRTC